MPNADPIGDTEDRLPYEPRYRSLDLWRGVACLMVLVFHSSLYQLAQLNRLHGFGLGVVTGVGYLWLGVPLFFVISGYCISATCDCTRRKPRSVLSYLWRRYRRIFPPFWAATALSVVLITTTQSIGATALFVDSVHPIPLPSSLSLLQWAGNLTLTETFRDHLFGGPSKLFLGQAWSLCYEEQFYLICGFLLFAAPRRFFFGAWVVSALVVGFKAIAVGLGLNIYGLFFDGRWLEFAIGIWLYWTLNYAGGIVRRIAHVSACAASALVLGAFVYGPSRALISGGRPLELAVGILFATLLLFLRPFDARLAASRPFAPLMWCGTMCYSLYLVHWPIAKLLSSAAWSLRMTSWPLTLFVTVPLCALLSILAARGFHVFVERRFINAPADGLRPGAIVYVLRLWTAWPFPRGRGLALRILRPWVTPGRTRPRWLKIRGFVYWTDLADFDARNMAVDRRYGARLIDMILCHLPVAGTFIDVGAHVGGITLPAASHVGPEGRVLAIEPNPNTATVLRRNLTKNLLKNTTVVELACLDERKRTVFYVNDSSHSGKSSLSGRNAGSRQTVTIECDTLDSIAATHEVDRVDVVKIDVEGAELQVLKGMERLLKEFLPIVILEVEPTLLEAFSTAAPDLWAFLAAKGYRAENIDSTNVIFTCPSTRCPATANYQPPAGDASAPRLIRHAAQAVLD